MTCVVTFCVTTFRPSFKIAPSPLPQPSVKLRLRQEGKEGMKEGKKERQGYTVSTQGRSSRQAALILVLIKLVRPNRQWYVILFSSSRELELALTHRSLTLGILVRKMFLLKAQQTAYGVYFSVSSLWLRIWQSATTFCCPISVGKTSDYPTRECPSLSKFCVVFGVWNKIKIKMMKPGDTGKSCQNFKTDFWNHSF